MELIINEVEDFNLFYDNEETTHFENLRLEVKLNGVNCSIMANVKFTWEECRTSTDKEYEVWHEVTNVDSDVTKIFDEACDEIKVSSKELHEIESEINKYLFINN